MEAFSEKQTLEQKLSGSDGVSHVGFQGNSVVGKGNNSGKNPRNGKEVGSLQWWVRRPEALLALSDTLPFTPS